MALPIGGISSTGCSVFHTGDEVAGPAPVILATNNADRLWLKGVRLLVRMIRKGSEVIVVRSVST